MIPNSGPTITATVKVSPVGTGFDRRVGDHSPYPPQSIINQNGTGNIHPPVKQINNIPEAHYDTVKVSKFSVLTIYRFEKSIKTSSIR